MQQAMQSEACRRDALSRRRPGKVSRIHGVIFQSDAASAIGGDFIVPAEAFDQWWAGLREPGAPEPLAMHAGLHVELEDGREFVVEQLAGGWRDLFVNGLHWTPLPAFRARDHADRGGWDLTVPVVCFRGIGPDEEAAALDRLRVVGGQAFLREDCTAFLGRLFGDARLFADSPFLRSLGVSVRSGEPSLPLLRPDAALPPQAWRLLRTEALRRLPPPQARHGTWSVRQLHHHLLGVGLALALGLTLGLARVLSAKPRQGRCAHR